MAYTIEYTQSAIEDIEYFRKFERVIIIETAERYLTHEPLQIARNRKPLDPNNLAQWEVRAGKYRIFYDIVVADNLVIIKAVGWKEHNTLYIRGKEYTL